MIKTVQDLIDSLERFKAKYGNVPVSIGMEGDPWTYNVSEFGELFIVDPKELNDTEQCHISDYANNKFNHDDNGWRFDFEGNKVGLEDDT